MAAAAVDPDAISQWFKGVMASAKPEPVRPSIRLERYFEMVRELMRRGLDANALGNYREAYHYLYRLALLVIEVLPQHPSWKAPQYMADRSRVKQQASDAITWCEALKPKVMEAYRQQLLAAQTKPTVSLDSAPSSVQTTPATSIASGGPTPSPLPFASPASVSDAKTPSSTVSAGSSDHKDDGTSKLEDPFAALRLSRTDSSSSKPSAAPDMISPYPTFETTVPSRKPQKTPTLRTLLVPEDLMILFEELARDNTMSGERGIETCGVLAGKMVRGAGMEQDKFLVTHLILPKQTGGPDQCGVTDAGETDLFRECMQSGLLTLGWIHTHPQQSCFLSSVDLHTHCAYQATLPEAIAIVIAPQDREHKVGTFNMTNPPGLGYIQNCPLKGFHAHDTTAQLYGPCSHVKLVRASLELRDLRK